MANFIRFRQLVKEIIELGSKSSVLADPKSKLFCSEYSKLRRDVQSPQLLGFLAQEFGFQNERLFESLKSVTNVNNAEEFRKNLRPGTYEKLNLGLKPQYYRLFQNLARVKDGVYTLVKLRQDLLDTLDKTKKTSSNQELEDQLRIMNSVLRNLLGLWFSTGLLDIQRIDWNSPASLVEKVAHYESVHRIRALNDLKTRLSQSRRCFLYTHSTIPYEPLVILHIALTNTISSSIDRLVRSYNKPTTPEPDPEKCTNAIFYSITSCQKGLQQVELGNSLIKSCVRLLIDELPNLRFFHTLSPIPKFREWLDLKLKFAETGDSSDRLLVESWLDSTEAAFFNSSKDDNSLTERVRNHLKSSLFRERLANGVLEAGPDQAVSNFLRRSCTHYLYAEKKNGFAFNSVANFHLKNGAQIFRVNFGADLSEHGWDSSYSMMVNYGYYLDELDHNCVEYLTNKTIRISDTFKKWLQEKPITK